MRALKQNETHTSHRPKGQESEGLGVDCSGERSEQCTPSVERVSVNLCGSVDTGVGSWPQEDLASRSARQGSHVV